jgi:hypothetical protein
MGETPDQSHSKKIPTSLYRLVPIVIILIALSFTSVFSELDSWWYARKSFPARVKHFRNNFQPGLVLPLFALEEDYSYKQAIDEIHEMGARSISFFVTNYQEDIRSDYIYLNRRAMEASRLTDIIDYSHRKGMSVFLFPTLHLQHLGHKEWRGVLKPNDPDLWWRNYTKLIRYYTNFSRENNVEVLSIGSELCSMEQEYDRWSEIIRYARKNYKGLLTYSANWDHYHDIDFVKDLDYLGINAYFGLTQKSEPTLEELLKAWEPAKKRIEEAYKEYKKAVIITEIGYPSVDEANRTPWNYFSKKEIDLNEQKLCYESFVKTWENPPHFMHAVYFYNWWGPGGSLDRDYTPRGKPAAEVLQRWYKSF